MMIDKSKMPIKKKLLITQEIECTGPGVTSAEPGVVGVLGGSATLGGDCTNGGGGGGGGEVGLELDSGEGGGGGGGGVGFVITGGDCDSAGGLGGLLLTGLLRVKGGVGELKFGGGKEPQD